MIPQHSDRRNPGPDSTGALPNHLVPFYRAIEQLISERLDRLTPAQDSDTLLTREEAAERLRISVRTLDDLEASGRLQAIRIGRRVLYHPETLDAFIRQQSREGSRR